MKNKGFVGVGFTITVIIVLIVGIGFVYYITKTKNSSLKNMTDLFSLAENQIKNNQLVLNTQINDIDNQSVENNLISENNKLKVSEDCFKKDFSMALIFVTQDINGSEIKRYKDELRYIKNRLPWAFNFATGGLATMSIPSDAVFINGQGLVSSGNFDLPIVLKKFYEKSADDYDFVSVFTDIKDLNTDYYHFNVQNKINGIGLEIFNNSATYSSKGKLKGVNYMNDMLDRRGSVRDCYKEQNNNFSTLSITSECGMGGILHETAHQWAVYVGDIVPGLKVGVTGSNPNKNLSIRKDQSHYYFGFSSPIGTVDLLGSGYWEKSSEGNLFLSNTLNESAILMKYHLFTLYFMGLLPESEYDTKFNIYQNMSEYMTSVGPIPSMGSIYGQVSVRDVIKREGLRVCTNE